MNIPPAILLATIAFADPAPAPQTISGPATVIDADTLRIGRVTVRLHGVDSPEIDQRCTDAKNRPYNCGLLAADVLQEEIAGAIVVCFPLNLDRYGRTVAVCTARDKDLSEQMVRRGYAQDYPFFSKGRYRDAEREAREERRGLWSGSFQPPQEFRQQQRR